ncbi:hypothetical protein 056SW001B_80 [Bacillus phage 056SW001B]|uniref:Uncharacterized protein n=1 Tax=Bacillus phage 056SW001B TaxID=2601663 RepID=A0A5P8PIJ3_9CAUD|nr:hypothetical protein 056SW001B_80 [Bacillus phage 056SW001B]
MIFGKVNRTTKEPLEGSFFLCPFVDTKEVKSSVT